jgi:hypothetical protein
VAGPTNQEYQVDCRQEIICDAPPVRLALFATGRGLHAQRACPTKYAKTRGE